MTRTACILPLALILASGAALAQQGESGDQDTSRISDEVIPLLTDIPARPRPIIELGDPLLGTGPLNRGIELPTGAVWQPSFIVFGQYRTALQGFDDGVTTTSEWANRLDLFGNLQLSGTERLLVGLRPLDDNGEFTSYNFEPDRNDGWDEHFNARLTHLFFEGDFGEIFPRLDHDDSSAHDYGFSIGRQRLLLQDGLLVNDSIDVVGVTRNTATMPGVSNLRISGLFGWNDIERDNNVEDDSAQLIGISAEADRSKATLYLDALWLHDNGAKTDAMYGGLGAVGRIGHYNATGRVVSSFPLHGDTPATRRGTLLFGELSRAPKGTDNIAYVNAFWGIRDFSSAARAPDAGGPLGRTGILYEAVGLGRYGAALGNRAGDSVGGAVGYQMFLDDTRRQVVLELGARDETDGPDAGAIAFGSRLQQAFGRRTIFRLDGFVSAQEGREPGGGLRFEVAIKF